MLYISYEKMGIPTAQTLKDNVVRINAKIKDIVEIILSKNLKKLVSLIIDLICNYKLFETSIGYLLDSFKQSSSSPERYVLWGKFIGSFLIALIS